MTPHVLDQSTRGTIRALMSRTGEVAQAARAATKVAQQERARRETEARKRRAEQDARERRLDYILAQAVRGLTAIIELGRTKEIKELASARASIGLPTPLYGEGDERTSVSVCFTKTTVELRILATVRSCCQSVKGPTSFVNCKVVRRYPFASKKPIGIGWFWYLFYADLHGEWHEHDFNDEEIPADRTSHWAVSDWKLQDFDQLDLKELANKDADVNWQDEGVDANLVLLRFLANCSDAKSLQRSLHQALANLN